MGGLTAVTPRQLEWSICKLVADRLLPGEHQLGEKVARFASLVRYKVSSQQNPAARALALENALEVIFHHRDASHFNDGASECMQFLEAALSERFVRHEPVMSHDEAEQEMNELGSRVGLISAVLMEAEGDRLDEFMEYQQDSVFVRKLHDGLAKLQEQHDEETARRHCLTFLHEMFIRVYAGYLDALQRYKLALFAFQS